MSFVTVGGKYGNSKIIFFVQMILPLNNISLGGQTFHKPNFLVHFFNYPERHANL